ncbi:MAG: peptide-methionine (R)-S-oxide reductase [Acidimicrobiales bacterium]
MRCLRRTLFTSDAKFDSGTGWPSFFDEIEAGRVKRIEDRSHGMVRIEAQCAGCNPPEPCLPRWPPANG